MLLRTDTFGSEAGRKVVEEGSKNKISETAGHIFPTDSEINKSVSANMMTGLSGLPLPQWQADRIVIGYVTARSFLLPS